MNNIFKRKSRSLPHLRKKIYSKIGNDCQQEQWKTFLANEQDLTSVLQQFSKAEFDIRNQDKFKYTARSVLMMKREAIRYLEMNQLQEGKNKLKELYQKINGSQVKKIGKMIIYLECREQLDKGISGKEQALICELKSKMAEHLNGNQATIIKIKILTILSILLLRFHGILMSTEEKFIIFKTIELKKTKMLQIDERQEREAEFQCLLYLLLELYKILYLLKKDQQTILFYYNQLHAYTQIYLTRQENKLYLDVNEINRILVSMKPILNDLDIYEDSKLRKDLAFAHIQQQILQQENSSSKILDIKKTHKTRFSSSTKIGSHKQMHKLSIRNDVRLVLNHQVSTIKNDICKEETVEDLQSIELTPINYQFLMVSLDRLFVVDLTFAFRNGCNLIDFFMTISNKSKRQIYSIRGVELSVPKLNFKYISRFMQKMIEFLYPCQPYFRQLNNLYFAEEFLPKQPDSDHILVALARAKTQIGHFLRTNFNCQSIVGFKFNTPQATLQQLKAVVKVQPRDQKIMITRREGIILQERFKLMQPPETCIKLLLKKEHDKQHQFYIFNIFFANCFKGIEIYYFNQREEQVELGEFLSSLKRISAHLIINHRIVNRHRVAQSILALQNRIDRVVPEPKNFKVQEQLQINQEKLKPLLVPIKSFRPQQKTKTKAKKPRMLELIKMSQNKYHLFAKEIRKGFMIYKNDIAKLYLPLNWKESSWRLVHTRLRIYAGIKILNEKQGQNYFIQSYREDDSLVVKEQLIILKFLRHYILRKSHGYCMMLEYQSQGGDFLYEIVASKQQRYYYLSSCILLDWKCNPHLSYFLGRYSFQLLQNIREKISEANWYFRNMLKGSRKLSRKYQTL